MKRHVGFAHRSHACLTALALCSATWAVGCGAGTAAAISGGDSSDGGNSPPVLSSFRVEHPRATPARPRFVLADQESNPATVEFFYVRPGESPQPMTKLVGLAANSATLATTAEGVEHELEWEFSSEPDLPGDGSFVDGVRVFATVRGGIQEVVLGANAQDVGLGNDPPEVFGIEAPLGETDGITPIRFHVRDSSRDVVAIRVEYDIVGDVPDTAWVTARPAGLPFDAPTPEVAFPGVEAPLSGVDLVFFWDTDADLRDLERDVRVRFVPADDEAVGEAAATHLFRVDNNEEPIADLDSGLLIANTDASRGIPIPFQVVDEEGDDVDVVLQWRRRNEEFPDLPSDSAAIAAILADPAARRAHRVAEPYNERFEGRVGPVDDRSLRLYELGTSALHLLASGVEGREIEILRGSLIPTRVASSWDANPLQNPVSALAIGDGIDALVLDEPTPGTWRLRVVRLSNGAVVRELVVNSPGAPSAMALDPRGRSALVAADIGGSWRVSRVDLESGAAVVVAAASGTTPQGRIRGIAGLTSTSALITVANALLEVRYDDPLAPKVFTLAADLQTPWGIVLDPLSENSAYIAERDWTTPGLKVPGRILKVDLDTLARHAVHVPVGDPSEPTFPRPRALALARGGARLIAVCDPDGLQDVVLGVDLGGHQSNATFDLASALGGDVNSVASGADGLVIAAIADADDLAVGGGVRERRTIASYDALHHLAIVAEPFDAAPRASDRWRISRTMRSIKLTSGTTRGVFLWDSEEAGTGDVFFRATPIDGEIGIASETAAPKRLSNWRSRSISLGPAVAFARSLTAAHLDGDGRPDFLCGTATAFVHVHQTTTGEFGAPPVSTAVKGASIRTAGAADMDGDGDADLVCVTGLGNAVFLVQASPGVFDPTPHLISAAAGTGGRASLQLADLDRDADVDVAFVVDSTNRLAICLQSAQGAFSLHQMLTSDVMLAPRSLDVGDLDADGDVDLVAANFTSGNLTSFLQTDRGTFELDPITLPAGGNGRPVAVVSSDLDRDGDAELVHRTTLGPLGIFVQLAPGEFDPVPIAIGSPVANTNGAVLVVDADGDGLRDVVSASTTGDVSFHVQHPNSSFDAMSVEIAVGTDTAPFPGLQAGDWNGDGTMDFASLSVSSGAQPFVTLTSRTGVAEFATASTSVDGPTSSTVDFDGDGDIDLINQSELTLRVQLQAAPGSFAQTAIAIPWNDPGVVLEHLADFDGNGFCDLVLSSAFDDSVVLLFQDEFGVFDPRVVQLGDVAAKDGGTTCSSGDMDADGDLDLLTANWNTNDVTIYRQTGAREFDPAPIALGSAATTLGPIEPRAWDLDDDGDMDLVVFSQQQSAMACFFQTAPGVFDPTPRILGSAASTPSMAAVEAVDFDCDGDLDLVAASPSASRLAVFEQTAPGIFSSQPIAIGSAESTQTTTTIAAADLDGDGDQDLAAGSISPGHIAIFIQDSPGVFRSPAVLLPGGDGIHEARDIDGDGDVDLLIDGIEIRWGSH